MDAAILTSSLPHPALKDLARQRRLVLVPVEGQDLDDLVAAYPLYQPVTIPMGTYPNQTRPCASVALQCLLVTRQRVDQEQVRNFLARIWPHWQELKAGHPVLPVDLKNGFSRIRCCRWPPVPNNSRKTANPVPEPHPKSLFAKQASNLYNVEQETSPIGSVRFQSFGFVGDTGIENIVSKREYGTRRYSSLLICKFYPDQKY